MGVEGAELFFCFTQSVCHDDFLVHQTDDGTIGDGGLQQLLPYTPNSYG